MGYLQGMFDYMYFQNEYYKGLGQFLYVYSLSDHENSCQSSGL